VIINLKTKKDDVLEEENYCLPSNPKNTL